jgi:hypothetical protein
MSLNEDPGLTNQYEVQNPPNLGVMNRLTTTNTMISMNNPRAINLSVIPKYLNAYKNILHTYEAENPNEKMSNIITDYNSFAKFMEVEHLNKDKEWPYYATLFPDNEDVLSKINYNQRKTEEQSKRNVKYHVIPNSWLESLDSFLHHVTIPYLTDTHSLETDNQIFKKIKQRLANKVIRDRGKFLNEIGNLGIDVYYYDLYNSLYIYNKDNPNRIPMTGGKKTRKARKRSLRKRKYLISS